MFDPMQPPIEGAAMVATVYNPVDASIIEDLLRQSGIPTFRRARLGLDPLPVLAGFSKLGEEIFVPAEKEADALGIIGAFTQGEGEIIEDDTEATTP